MARTYGPGSLADILRAADRRRAVTVTYTRADGTDTVRTIEVSNASTTAEGHIVLTAMDRETGERRTFRTDRISSYTVHCGTYQVRAATPAPSSVFSLHATAADLYDAEMARGDRPAHRDAALTVVYLPTPADRRVLALAVTA